MQFQLLVCLLLSVTTFASQDQQIPMAHNAENDYTPLTTSKPLLADLLTIESSASIFYSYARELELSRMLSDPSASITIFVPSNRAVMALARKPHQDPPPLADDGIDISEEEFDKKSRKNVERWVSAHIIPESLITLKSQEYPTLLERKSIRITPVSKNNGKGADWSRVTVEDGVHITGMKEGLNGVLYFIDGTIVPT